MEYNKEALAYFKKEGVSVVFLFRHNLLRRYVSILANLFDKEAKSLNGTHKSHVHSRFEQVLGIQKFLGVIPRKLTSHHVKIHTQPLSKQIQNWLEVYEMLKGTEFEGFLGDK